MKKLILFLIAVVALSFNCDAKKRTVTVDQAFEQIARIPNMQLIEYIEDDIKFPAEVGTPQMLFCGNAEPRDAILKVLKQLPNGAMLYDKTDERGVFDRIFVNEANDQMLYVHAGFGGNDTVAVLFTGGNKDSIKAFIDKLNAE